jgi:hypothetical protein
LKQKLPILKIIEKFEENLEEIMFGKGKFSKRIIILEKPV